MEKPSRKAQFFKYLRWTLWVLLAQFILFNISAALYAYKFTHVYDAPAADSKGEARKPNFITRTWRLFSGPMQRKAPVTGILPFEYDTVLLKTSGGKKIDTWYAAKDSLSKGTVILFHGLLVNKEALFPEAGEFFYQGYSVMLVDFRAHGSSDGNTTTLGIKEAEEVKLAYDYISAKGEKSIFLYGTSMGAVTVSKAIADYGLQPKGVILEMPFASLQSLIRARARAQGYQGGIINPFSFLVTFWMGAERGLKTFKHQTTNYVSKITCPVLMQWGAADNYVLKEETDRIYNAIASANKKLVIYTDAGHESLLQKDTGKWRRELETFFAVFNQH